MCVVVDDRSRAEHQVRTGLDLSRPNAARVYNYWLGGKDHFAADREAAEAVLFCAVLHFSCLTRTTRPGSWPRSGTRWRPAATWSSRTRRLAATQPRSRKQAARLYRQSTTGLTLRTPSRWPYSSTGSASCHRASCPRPCGGRGKPAPVLAAVGQLPGGALPGLPPGDETA